MYKCWISVYVYELVNYDNQDVSAVASYRLLRHCGAWHHKPSQRLEHTQWWIIHYTYTFCHTCTCKAKLFAEAQTLPIFFFFCFSNLVWCFIFQSHLLHRWLWALLVKYAISTRTWFYPLRNLICRMIDFPLGDLFLLNFKVNLLGSSFQSFSNLLALL